MKKILITLLSIITVNANAEVINLVAVSNPPECRAGKQCDIYGHHEIYVINASKTSETFNYSYQLCMEGICDDAQNIITIPAGQTWINSRQSQLHLKMTAGKHIYYVRTECGKEKMVHDYTVKVK